MAAETQTNQHRVQVLRHAKSSWGEPGVDDHQRTLAPRGRRACAALAKHLAGIAHPPDLVLCSSAQRARETLEGVRPGLPDNLTVEVEDDLYGASAGALLRRLRDVPDEVRTVMIVGHNPGFEDLARWLSGAGNSVLVEKLGVKYPTGGLATIAFDGPWGALEWGEATLEDFVVPADLKD